MHPLSKIDGCSCTPRTRSKQGLVYQYLKMNAVALKILSIHELLNCSCRLQFTMPSTCLVCREEGDKGFFALPKNKIIRESWIKEAKLSDFFIKNPLMSQRICWRHFNSSQIKSEGQRWTLVKGMFLQGWWKLKELNVQGKNKYIFFGKVDCYFIF